jgi:hypothetical protein
LVIDAFMSGVLNGSVEALIAGHDPPNRLRHLIKRGGAIEVCSCGRPVNLHASVIGVQHACKARLFVSRDTAASSALCWCNEWFERPIPGRAGVAFAPAEVAMDSKILTPLLVYTLVVFVIVRRMRRSFGRQRVQPRRLTVRIGILGFFGVLVTIGSLASDRTLAAALAGCACGAALGYAALRHTRFEVTPEGRYYTPHTYIGIAVTALFIARVLYRLLWLYQTGLPIGASQTNPLMTDERTPLTVALLGALLGYYLCYYVGVLRRTRAKTSPSANPIQS